MRRFFTKNHFKKEPAEVKYGLYTFICKRYKRKNGFYYVAIRQNDGKHYESYELSDLISYLNEEAVAYLKTVQTMANR